jgi:hypothetical protein
LKIDVDEAFANLEITISVSSPRAVRVADHVGQIDLDRFARSGKLVVVEGGDQLVPQLVGNAVSRLQLGQDLLVESRRSVLAEYAVRERYASRRTFGYDASTVAEGALAFVVGDHQGVTLSIVRYVKGAARGFRIAQVFHAIRDLRLEQTKINRVPTATGARYIWRELELDLGLLAVPPHDQTTVKQTVVPVHQGLLVLRHRLYVRLKLVDDRVHRDFPFSLVQLVAGILRRLLTETPLHRFLQGHLDLFDSLKPIRRQMTLDLRQTSRLSRFERADQLFDPDRRFETLVFVQRRRQS